MWTLPRFDWPEQKAQCLSCRHCQPVKDSPRMPSGATILLCSVGNRKGRRGIGTCIDNRTLGKCGPSATLWEAKDA